MEEIRILIDELYKRCKQRKSDLEKLYVFLESFIDSADSHVELEPLVTEGRELLRSMVDDPKRYSP